MKPFYKFLILSFFVSLSAHAQAKASFVDLSYEFQPQVPLQKGATCSAYSAIQIMEAACFRRTHQKLKLSDHYLIYETIRKTLTEHLEKNPDATVDPNHDPDYLVGENLDSSFSSTDLQNFVTHDVLTDAEFRGPEDFFNIFSNGRKSQISSQLSFLELTTRLDKFALNAAQNNHLNIISQSPDKTQSALESTALQHIGSKPTGFQIATSEPNLQQCLNEPAQYGFDDKEHATPKRALELLNAGIPFIFSRYLLPFWQTSLQKGKQVPFARRFPKVARCQLYDIAPHFRPGLGLINTL